MNQSEFETLMMAHDNLQRELADIKQRIGKDKHALIKSNIALNRKVKELEEDNESLQALSKINRKEHMRIHEQNKRYREVIEETLQSMGMVDKQKYGKALERVLEGEE